MRYYPEFSRLLNEHLTQTDRSPTWLARRLGLSPSTVTRWLNHDMRPASPEIVVQIADVLGVTKSREEILIAAGYGYKENNPATTGNSASAGTSQTHQKFLTTRQQNWGEAPDVSIFHGRQTELNKLSEWIIKDSCRLIGVVGMGGMGKTALSTKLALQIQEHFSYIVWRSLRNAPPFEEILRQCLQIVSDQQVYELPTDLDSKISLLIHYLRQERCLIVFDNVETILGGGGQIVYRSGFEDYGQLIQRIGESVHQSCLLITSRETPYNLGQLEGEKYPVHILQLTSLEIDAGYLLLIDKGLSGPSSSWSALIEQYSGNPLALKVVGETIRELFDGDIDEFLREDVLIFGGVRSLLDQQFERLSSLEQEIIFWFAIEREGITLNVLQDDLVRPVSRSTLLEALQSLQRRSLLEKTNHGFTLQNVVMEYIVDRLVEQVIQEILTGKITLFQSHALLKAQAKDYISKSQTRLILQPITEQLIAHLGQVGVEERLRYHLTILQTEASLISGYAGGNILNLILHLNDKLIGYDFSGINVWQADLRGRYLYDVNFSNADLTGVVFADTFWNIPSVAYSPNNKLVAAGTFDGQIRMWEAESGQTLLAIEGHSGIVMSVSFSPDGQILASGGEDQVIRLWNVKTGQCLKTLSGHTDCVNSVSFSADSQILASGSDDHTVRLWNVETGQCLKTLSDHTNWVYSIAFSPIEQILASGSFDQTVRLWDVKTGQCLQTLSGHTNKVRSVAFNPNGQILASGGEDLVVRLWDVQTGHNFKNLPGHTNFINSVAFSPDGQTLASGSADQTVCLWNIQSGKSIDILVGHTNGVHLVAFSPDGQTLASGSDDQTVRLWDVHTGQNLRILMGHTNWIRTVAFSPNDQILASGNGDQTVRLWDVQTGKCLKTLSGHTNWVWSVAFSPDGQTLASGSDDQTVRLWNIHTGQNLRILMGHTKRVRAVTFSPDGQILASGGADQTIYLWNTKNWQNFKSFAGHSGWVNSMAFSPNSQILASASGDQTVRLWDIQTGKCLKTLSGHTNWVWSVAFSPDGQTLASCGDDRTVRLWNVHTGQNFKTLSEHTKRVRAVTFSPDSQFLVSGGDDQTVRLWDVHTGQNLKTLRDHTNWVNSVAFRSEGQTFASGSTDETIKLWDMQTGGCLETLQPNRPYERVNITGVTGLTQAQIVVLKTLGAVERTN